EADDITQETLSERIGKTQASINQYLTLTKLKPEVQQIINRFINFKLAHILQICRLEKPQDQIKLAEEAAKAELSVKELKKRIDNLIRSGETGKRSTGETLKTKSPDPLADVWDSLDRDQLNALGEWNIRYNAKDDFWSFTIGPSDPYRAKVIGDF